MGIVERLQSLLRPTPPSELPGALERWLEASEPDVVVLEHRFHRCELERDAAGVNLVLPAATLLASTAENAMGWAAAQGYAFDDERGGYRRHHAWSRLPDRNEPAQVATALARELQDTLRAVFDLGEDARPVLTREPRGTVLPRDLTTPDAFAQAMTRLAGSRSQADRRAVYEAFVNARLLLPLRVMESSPQRPEVLPAKERELRGTVWATFTNWSDADRWRHREWGTHQPWAVISGLQLLALASSHHLTSLLINPSSRLGGEFYRHELAHLAEILGLTTAAP